MVTGKQQPEANADDDGFEIVDTTPPEVDAAIGAAVAQVRAASEAPSTEAAPPSQESESTPEKPAVADATPSPQPTAEPETKPAPPVQQPAPRTYTEEQWGQMRRAMQERENAALKRAAELEAKQRQIDLDAQVEAYRREMSARLQQQYNLDPQSAETLARTDAEAKRQAYQYELDKQRMAQERAQLEASFEEIARREVAMRVIAANGLDDSDFSVLLAAQTPEAMLTMGKKLGDAQKALKASQAQKQAAVKPVKVDSGARSAAPVSDMDSVLARIDSGQESDEDWRKYEAWRAQQR